MDHLCKFYPNKKALDNVSFSVDSGEIVALIGKNGAGKTTLMNSIASIIYPTSGSIFYKGTDLLADNSYLQEFGILINATFFEYLSAYSNLKMLMIASGSNARLDADTTIMNTLRLVGLEGQAYKSVKSFSFGMKQRLGLAQTLLTPIKFMILDEPFVGLDPLGKQILKDVIIKKAHQEKCGVLFSSHDLTDVTEICDRIVMIADGKKAYDDVFHDEKWYVIPIQDNIDSIKLQTMFQNCGNKIVIKEHKIEFQQSSMIYEIQQKLLENNIKCGELEIRENSLYDFFKEDNSCK